MDGNFFMGIDVGTTSVKGILADVVGNILATSTHTYELEMEGDRCELEAQLYWEKTKSVVKELLDRSGVDKKRVQALSFSSQGETLICIDPQGNPLRKAIVWLDNRSKKEARAIENNFGAETICDRTGQPHIQPLWPATRIAWLRKHEPELFERVHKFLLVEDFLIFRFTGQYATEHTLVSSTLYYDIRKKQWWSAMLDYLGISAEQLPSLFPSATVISTITEDAAQETGLSASTRIVTGAYDHVAGALGAGNLTQGAVSETTGTSLAMVVTLNEPIANFAIHIPMQCHAIPGKYLLLPYGQTAGFVLKWFKEQFCHHEIAQKGKHEDEYDCLTRQAEGVAPGCNGLTMLPHLMGSGSPEFNAEATGVFAGITVGTTKGHFIRAILEAVACMLKRNLDVLKDAGILVNEIRALGGGSKSNLWNQIKADLTNVPITTVHGQDTAALGAAIIAATGSGFFPALEYASKKMVKLNRTFTPDQRQYDQYKSAYMRYVNLTKSLEKYGDG